jgi:hypothetical protein
VREYELPALPVKALAGITGHARWWEPAQLRALVGERARLLGHDYGPRPGAPEYGFMAADITPAGSRFRMVRRSCVVLKIGTPWALIAHDFAAPRGERPPLELASGQRHTSLPPRAVRVREDEAALLDVVQIGGTLPVVPVTLVNLAGAMISDRVVLFYTEPYMARSMVSFDVDAGGRLKFLVTGLAPGTWEIWWNGWLEDPQGGVEPEAGALYFQGEAGSYFLKRIGG